MKQLKLIMMAMLAACLLAACSSDDETTGYEEYDAEYQIKYYSRPPYADLEQGYWYKDNTREVFFKLTPNTEAPYQLLVCPKNDKGRRTLEYMEEKGDGVIINVYKQVHYFDMNFTDSTTHYFVTSTKYFESPDLYVSDNYFSTECGMREGDYCRIVPTIIINLNAGADIKNIEAEYKDVMTLRYTNGRHDSRFTTYHFDCQLSNSYEVLRLADELYRRDDVNWADADKYSPIYFDI
jgi:hypothetical protein